MKKAPLWTRISASLSLVASLIATIATIFFAKSNSMIESSYMESFVIVIGVIVFAVFIVGVIRREIK